MLAAALAVELVDELADGTRTAALPLIQHDLGLSYGQLGLLASAPVLIGSLLELPVGALAGQGRRRHRIILAGGAVFLAALLGAALAWSFAGLLISFIAFYPASGAFVSLTQASLMDADPGRQDQHMARWTLAGVAGRGARPAAADRDPRGRRQLAGLATWSPPPQRRWPGSAWPAGGSAPSRPVIPGRPCRGRCRGR